jgi:hypothetical protein
MIFIPDTYQNASWVFCVAQFRDETGRQTDAASSSPLREEKVLLFLTISSLSEMETQMANLNT